MNETVSTVKSSGLLAQGFRSDVTPHGATLDPAHREYLTLRGISDEVIKNRGYFSVDLAQHTKGNTSPWLMGLWSPAQRAHFTTPYKGEPLRGLAIPLRGVEGECLIHQLRPDAPRMVEVESPAMKAAMETWENKCAAAKQVAAEKNAANREAAERARREVETATAAAEVAAEVAATAKDAANKAAADAATAQIEAAPDVRPTAAQTRTIAAAGVPTPVVVKAVKPTAAQARAIAAALSPVEPKLPPAPEQLAVSYRPVKFELPSLAIDDPNGDGGEVVRVTRGDTEGSVPADFHPLMHHGLTHDEGVPLFITEGTCKGDAVLTAAIAEEADVAVMSVTGVTMLFYGASNVDNPTPGRASLHEGMLGDVPLEERTVYLCWDADWSSNRSVRKALETTAGLLQDAGATVRIVNVPVVGGDAGTGVDDWLASEANAARPDALRRLLAGHTFGMDALKVLARETTNDDVGRGERLADWLLHKGGYKFVVDSGVSGTWWAQEGGVWRKAGGNAAVSMEAQALTLRDKHDEVAFATSRALERVNAAVRLAATQPALHIQTSDFDLVPTVLNVRNGTLCLLTGKLSPHSTTDLHTKQTSCGFDPDATAPTWDAFLATTFGGDKETVAMVQRWAGSTLFGDVRDEKLAVFFGATGNNGKTSLLEALTAVMGDYAGTLPPEAITGDLSDEMKASIAGLRLTTMAESGAGERLDSKGLKQLVSRDTITGRQLFSERTTIKPSWSIALSTNHIPRADTDSAVWRRLLLVPFLHRLPDEEVDVMLNERLQAEASGILCWLIEGCLQYQQQGLGSSPAIDALMSKELTRVDTIGQFLAEACLTPGDNTGTEVAALRARRSDLYRAFQAWMLEQGRKPWSLAALMDGLTTRGVIDADKPTFRSGGHVMVAGVGLLQMQQGAAY